MLSESLENKRITKKLNKKCRKSDVMQKKTGHFLFSHQNNIQLYLKRKCYFSLSVKRSVIKDEHQIHIKFIYNTKNNELDDDDVY